MRKLMFSERHDAGYEGDRSALWNEENYVVSGEPPPWRKRGAMKTAHGALVLCLNIGTDPPDVVKTKPTATTECWLNPFAQSRQKSLAAIGDALQVQYTGLASRTSYQQLLDPPVDQLRRVCQGLRRRARSDRVLFHYNGHGVPRPTLNGEIWLFNNDYTQYIPLSLNDLRANMVGSPAIYVFDCSGAGQCLSHFAQPVSYGPPFAEDPAMENGGDRGASLPQHQSQQHPSQMRIPQLQQPSPYSGVMPTLSPTGGGGGGVRMQSPEPLSRGGSEEPLASSFSEERQEIVLVPCSASELLPMEPHYPADLFTTCLTTPIPIALRWFVMENRMSMGEGEHVVEACNHIPGRLNERKTPLGELSWIFTSITDSIAWNCLPRHRFHSLFRQDLMVASLFRNFLLADRVLRSLGCTPASNPRLPPNISLHPLWQSWDLAAESSLSNLLGLRIPPSMPPANTTRGSSNTLPVVSIPARGPAAVGPYNNGSAVGQGAGGGAVGAAAGAAALTATAAVSPFFAEQLTAFEVWLDVGAFGGLDKIAGLGRSSSGGDLAESGGDFGGDENGYFYGDDASGEGGTAGCCPEQLPMVLQVLLSQTHRLRALQLLRRFFEIGAPAVLLALNVGIFPYVLKLLQSPDAKLRQALVGIWARILALDRSTQVDLVAAGAHVSFAQHLVWEGLHPEQHVNAAFVLAHMCDGYRLGQQRCLEQGLHRTLHALLTSTASFPTPPPPPAPTPAAATMGAGAANNSESRNGGGSSSGAPPSSPQPSSSGSSWRRTAPQPPLTLLLRRWLCLCAGSLHRGYSPAQHAAVVEEGTHLSLQHALALDPCVEVRAASAFALSCLFGFSASAEAAAAEAAARNTATTSPLHHSDFETLERLRKAEVSLALELVAVVERRVEASPFVRREVALALFSFATCTERHKKGLETAATAAAVALGIKTVSAKVEVEQWVGEVHDVNKAAAQAYARVWQALVSLCGDPFPPVAEAARLVAAVAREPSESLAFVYAQAEVVALREAHGVYRWSCTHFTKTEMRGGEKGAAGGGGAGGVSRGVCGGEMRDGGFGATSSSSASSASASSVVDPLSDFGARALYWQRRKDTVDQNAKEFSSRSQQAMEEFREAAERNEAEQRSILIQQHPGMAGGNGGGGGGGGGGSYLGGGGGYGGLGGHSHGRLGGGVALATHQNQQLLLQQRQQQQQQRNSIVSPIAAMFRDPTAFFRNESSPRGSSGRGGTGAMPVVPKCLSFDQSIILENQNSEMTSLLLFHPYEALLAVGDDKDGVSLWSYEDGERWWHLRNGNPKKTRMTSFEWINEDGPSRLAVASDDGIIRFWGGVLEDDGRTGGGGCGGGGSADSRDDSTSEDDDSSSDQPITGNGAYGDDDSLRGEGGANEGGAGTEEEDDDFGSSGELDGPRMVTSFVAVPDISQWRSSVGAGDDIASDGSGVVTSYSHAAGHMFVGGQSSRIRLWDLNSEACVASWGFTGGSNPDTYAQDSSPHGYAPQCVTTLCCAGASQHQGPGSGGGSGGIGHSGGGGDTGMSSSSSSGADAAVVLGGFSDGAVRLFDSRLPSERNCVAVWHEHDAWVVSAHLSLSTHGAVSASVNGDVNFLDLRVSSGPIRSLDVLASSYTGAETSTSMSAFAAHPAAPIIAVGSHAQFIKVLTLDGYVLKWMKYHDGFLGQRIGPVSCLAFHPNRGVMAAGATDSIISVYSNSE